QGGLVAVEGDTGLGRGPAEGAAVARAVEMPGLAGLADDDDGDAVDLAGDAFGLLAAGEVVGLQLGALLLEAGLVGVGGAKRLLLRQEVVAGEAGLHAHHLAHLAELLDALEQDDVHGETPTSTRRGGG